MWVQQCHKPPIGNGEHTSYLWWWLRDGLFLLYPHCQDLKIPLTIRQSSTVFVYWNFIYTNPSCTGYGMLDYVIMVQRFCLCKGIHHICLTELNYQNVEIKLVYTRIYREWLGYSNTEKHVIKINRENNEIATIGGLRATFLSHHREIFIETVEWCPWDTHEGFDL